MSISTWRHRDTSYKSDIETHRDMETLHTNQTWRHMEKCGDTWRHMETYRDTQRHRETLGDLWRHTGTHRDMDTLHTKSVHILKPTFMMQ